MSGRLRRSLIGTIGVLVLVWQAGFVAPRPVRAVDPLPPPTGYMDCGNGFVCGPVNPNPDSPPIVVTGPEDRVIQSSAADPWAFIEQEAKAYVAAVHQVPVDSRLTDWARDELRAYILSRLLSIAAMPFADRTTREQVALMKFQALVKAKQIEAAQKAVDMYDSWNNNLCEFRWPSEISNNPDEYYHREGVEGWCINPLGGIFAKPASPSAEEFTAMATAYAYRDLKADPDGQRVIVEMITAAAFFGGLGVAAVAASIALVVTFATPALVAAYVSTIFPYAVAFVSDTIAFAALTPAVSAFTVAAGIAGAVMIAVVGAVVIGIAIWQQVVQADVPIQLIATRDHVAKALYAPDIDAMSKDEAQMGILTSVFAQQTLPDYASSRVNAPPAHEAADPIFAVVQHFPIGFGTFFDVPILPAPSAISPNDWDGDPQTAYMASGWWVDDTVDGPPTYRLRLPYLTPDGEKWEASVTQVKVAATASIPAHLEPSLIHDHVGHPDDSRIDNTFDYRSGGINHTATLTPAPQNWPPIVKPAITGETFVEGDTITFRANATDPNDDPTTAADEDPLTVDWFIEAPDTPNIIASGNDGISSLDRCYTAPLAETTGGAPSLYSCPWPHRTGEEVTFRYIDSGKFHVHVVVADSHGARASQVFEVAITNAPAAVTLSEPTTFTIDEGQSIDLGGQFTDPGDDPAKVVVDWGDGETSTQFFPCDWSGFAPGAPDSCIPDPANGRVPPAADPSAFTFSHIYGDDAPGTGAWPIEVTVFDDDGGATAVAAEATVNNVEPELYVHCGTTAQPPPDVIIFDDCDQRFGVTSAAIPLTGHFIDPGQDTWTLLVDWGDATTESFAYPCAAAGPCPFSLTATHPLGLDIPPPDQQRIYYHIAHAYAGLGTYSIGATITDDDAGSDTGTASAAITGYGAAPSISGTPPDGIVGTAYGPFSFTVGGDPSPLVSVATGALPPGITLSSVGTLSGTPTAKGNYSFTARASNGVPPDADDAITIAIAGRPQDITFGELSAKTYGASPFAVSASAASGLQVSFTAAPPGVCTAGGDSGATITIVGVGSCTVTAHQAGDATIWTAAPGVGQPFSVGPKTATVTVTPPSVQYSDPVPALNVLGSVSGVIGGDALAGALANCSASGLVVGAGKVLSAAGSYPLTGCSGLSNPNYAVAYSGSLQVTKETATATYTGPNYVSTGSATGTKVNVTLTGQLTQDADGSPGDLTKATADFLLYNSGNLTMTTPDQTVPGIVAASGAVNGTAPNLAVDTYVVVLRIRPGNTFFAGPESDADVLTVFTPATDVWVSGGGSLIDPSYQNIPVAVSATHPKGRFGFNVQYAKKSSTAPKGNATYSFRGADGYIYVIKSSSWQGGALALSGANAAYFAGKGVVVARDPRTGLAVPGIGGGNFSFRVDIVNGGSGGSNDTYALSVYTPSGVLYHRVGSTSSPIAVTGGNLTVHLK